ncbi:MAG: heat-inducible transcriptional repressor HrcA [Cumulibacter sp.]
MSTQQRRLDVLRAVVADFVSTNEPVGSKGLVERHNLGVSAATIRNDMAALEEEGYITHPHTSAGRIPTGKGYRLFVDELDELRPMSGAERRAIERFIEGAVDLDDVLRRSVRLLSQLTRQAAVISYPSLLRSVVRHIEIVPVASTRVMVVLITESGRVEQRSADIPAELGPDDIVDLRNAVNSSLAGQELSDAAALVAGLPDTVSAELSAAMAVVCTLLLDALVEPDDGRVMVGGAANLTRQTSDFHSSLGEVLDALEEHVILLKLIDESASAGVRVSIGEENPTPGLWSTSIVSTSYGDELRHLGGLAVVGPTRMDYAANMGAVMTVARYVSRLIHGG